MISTEKPGSPAELAHFGTKGMKWGVRKADGSPRVSKSTAKKVAIGAGVTLATAGAAFVAYKMGSGGHIPVSTVASSAKNVSAAKQFISSAGSTGSEAAEAARYAEMFLKNVK